jgi:hypothetical protein
MSSLGSAVLAVSASSASGCGRSKDHWPAGQPRIDQLEFLQQAPGNPLSLSFGITFVDSDGDLGGGTLELHQDASAEAAALADVFGTQHPPIADDATAGEIDVPVKIDPSVKVGQRIKIGFVLVDAAMHRSNQPSITLEAKSNSTGLSFDPLESGGAE